MKKLFLVPLMALMTCVSVYAVEVSTLQELKAALAAGGEIKLTANITASEALDITKATTIDGNGFALKNTYQDALGVYTSEAVVVKNLTVYAAASNGRAIGVRATTSNITLDNVVFNCNARGVTYYSDANDDCVLNVRNSTIQYVLRNPSAPAKTLQNAEVDTWGNPLNINYDECAPGNDGRGISLWEMTNSTVTIDNSTIQGFDYDVNCGPSALYGNNDYTGTSVTATKSIFKGRCAYNIHVGNAVFEFTDCTVTGVNCFTGPSESFACFVLDKYSNSCKLTINGGSVATARFTDNAEVNANAREFMVTDRGTNNKIVINNASYTCPKDLGVQKGGVVEETQPTSDITINGGTYDCPNIVGETDSDGEGNTGSITITGGEFNLSTISPDMDNSDMYSTVEIQGGTFQITTTDPETGAEVVVDIAKLVDPNNAENTLLGSTSETIKNQDGTVSVVPQGTGAATEKVDPAIKTKLVWGTDVTMTAQNVVVQPTQTLTLNSGTANAYRLDMGQNATVIVKSGSTLNIGEGGVALNNNGANDPQIIVEQGATLVLNGLMYGSVPENLIIKASADSYGQLLVNPDVQAFGDNHPNGTYEFVTKSRYVSASDYTFERFGVPTYVAPTSFTSDADIRTRIWVYSYALDDWEDLSSGTKDGKPHFQSSDASKLNKPFVGYNLMAYTATDGTKYRMKGALQGNSNASLDVDMKWTSFANSYTAEVDIEAFLPAISGNVDASVYLATPDVTPGTYLWNAINVEDLPVKKITPMRAFLLNNRGSMSQVITANYKNTVWDPGTGAAAPARQASSDNSAKVKMHIANEIGRYDNLVLVENQKFTSEYESGHDAEQYMNADINLYAHAEDNLAIMATDNMADTYIGFSTVEGGNFTISFTIADGRAFDLVDLETGAKVAIAKGETYTFHADANTVADYRFKIVERQNVVTGISNLTDDSTAKGIYTIMGQYLGEMNLWNTLPAGVYVVNGEKRVK